MCFMVHIPKLDQNERVRFKVADCVVVPSRYEPFGLTVCEAWSAGKVVVVAWHFWHLLALWHLAITGHVKRWTWKTFLIISAVL